MNRYLPNEPHTFQLQQTILYLKAELSQAKRKIHELETEDHYTLTRLLEHEKAELQQQLKHLRYELHTISRQHQHEQLQHKATAEKWRLERQKKNATIEKLLHTTTLPLLQTIDGKIDVLMSAMAAAPTSSIEPEPKRQHLLQVVEQQIDQLLQAITVKEKQK